jgi:uncharacterized protein VirK/YbjX
MGESHTQSFQPSVDIPIRNGFGISQITCYEDRLQACKFDDFLRTFKWLLKVARQRLFWAPAPIAGELWRLLTNFGAQREILRLLKLPLFAEIVQDNPRLAFKYVIPNYLARSLTQADRVSCFLYHYRRIYEVLPEHVLRQILRRDVIFHETSRGVNHFALTIGLSKPYFDQEGELSLNLQVNGKRVFNLSFTVVPGRVTKSKASETLLITRLQGTPGCNSEIKLATKALFDYSPRGPLLAALQGFAEVFAIREIEAVSAANLRSYRRDTSTMLKSGYDNFFAKVGMVKTSADFYSSCLPMEGKPLNSFKGGDRPRARRRRAMRQQIKSACASFLLGITDRATDSPPGSIWAASMPVAVDPRLVTTSCNAQDNLNRSDYSESKAETS